MKIEQPPYTSFLKARIRTLVQEWIAEGHITALATLTDIDAPALQTMATGGVIADAQYQTLWTVFSDHKHITTARRQQPTALRVKQVLPGRPGRR